jgi:magnesium transporter
VISVWRYREGVDVPESLAIEDKPAAEPTSLLWIDCEAPDNETLAEIGKCLGLHEFVIEDLQHAQQRTKLDRYADHYHVAVYDCVLVGDADDADGDFELATQEIDVVFGEGWLLSVRQETETDRDAFLSADTVKHRFEVQRRAHGSEDEGFLLWALLDVVVDRYFLISDGVDERLDSLQEVVLDDDVDRIRRGRPRQLFALSKSLLRFRRAALPLREVVAQLLRREDPDIGDEALEHFQDLYDHVLRVADLAESQRDVLTGLRDADLAVTSNQMSLVQQKIAAWGAILIVATLITGLLGMNFRDAPAVGWQTGFGIILGLMALLALPMYLYFKRRKWL